MEMWMQAYKMHVVFVGQEVPAPLGNNYET